jgi:hypothetical protein
LFEISDVLNTVNDRNTVQQAAYMSGVQSYFDKVLGSNGRVEFAKEHEKYLQ